MNKETLSRKMMIKSLLVQGLFLLALAGFMMHFRIHSPMKDIDNLIPFMIGLVSVIAVPLMFHFKPTITLAYILNSFSVIIGTITMAHFSIVHYLGPVTVQGVLLNTTLADIAILWGKFAIGKAIFDLENLKSDQDVVNMKYYFKYPNTGFWITHLFVITIIYFLGNILWR